MGFEQRDNRPAPAPADPRELGEAMAQPVKFSHSPELGELAKALAAAQGRMANAQRSAENPGRKRQDGTASKYADLAAARAEWRDPLAENGLALVQVPVACGSRMALVTMLIHGASGQWLRGEYPIDVPMNDPQRIGSAITYARRYAGMALTGLAPEDDDGNAASDAARREADGRGRERNAPQNARPRAGNDRRPAGQQARAAGDEPAWKQLVAFRVHEANDEWQNEMKIQKVPEDKRTELTNPSRCVNGIVTKWVDEGIIDPATLGQDSDPEKRDWKKVHAALAADHAHDRETFDKDIRAYLQGRRDRAFTELGLEAKPAG